jgi:hypothetical protein
MLVPTVRTPTTKRDIARAILRVSPDLSKEAVGVLWGQHACETADGLQCWNFNFGNIKHFKGDGYDHHALRGVFEYVDGKRVELTTDDPGSWFRSFPSLDAGIADHVRFLHSKRYLSTWPFVLAGDPDGFAHDLGRCGYFTAPPEAYARILLSKHRVWMVSSAYEEAVQEILLEDDSPTAVDQLVNPTPASTPQPDESAIVHPRVPLRRALPLYSR